MSKTMGFVAFEAHQKANGWNDAEIDRQWNRVMWGNASRAHWETAANAVVEECAKVADYWASGAWRVTHEKRKQFNIYDMQAVNNSAARNIAEEIRALTASAPASGDRTESAPRSPVVEPSLWGPEAEKAASEARDNEFDTGEPGPSREPTGLFSQLTEEQKRAVADYDGPEVSGSGPGAPKGGI